MRANERVRARLDLFNCVIALSAAVLVFTVSDMALRSLE